MVKPRRKEQQAHTSSGEKAKVTRALEAKFTRTATLSPRPRSFSGKTSEIMSQPIGPNDNCKVTTSHQTDKEPNITHRQLLKLWCGCKLATIFTKPKPTIFLTGILSYLSFGENKGKLCKYLVAANIQ
jgi:hypothetical protein